MKWLVLLGLAVCVNAQSRDPARWVGVGHLTDDIVMYYSIRVDEALSYLDFAVLVKLDAETTRNEPDGYHPSGGAELGSHSIFYDEHTGAVWVDGNVFFRLGDTNVVLLAEALAPGRSPRKLVTTSAGREIPSRGPVMNRDVQDLILAAPEIQEYVESG